MAKTQQTMPSSVATVSTENDSLNSPGERQSHHAAAEVDSPATSTSSPAQSPPERVNGYDKVPPRHDHGHTKRKRSNSLEEATHSPRHYDYSPPPIRSEQTQHMAGQALNVMTNSHSGPKRTYFSPAAENERTYYQESRTPHEGSTHLPQDDSNHDGMQYTSPPPGETGHNTEGSGSPSSHANGQGQSGKRKRNFSNRTKTGCITCRQRKKKCDEARPICNNCHRGGFKCQGYTVVRGSSWPKSNGVKGPVPLQSKDGHLGSSEVETSSVHHHQPQQQHHASHAAPPIESIPDTNHGQFNAGPESRSRPSYTGQAWPRQQGHPQPYTNEHLPPLAELARSDNTKPEYSSVPPHPPPPPAPRDMSGRPPSQSIPPSVPAAPNPQSGHWPPQSEFRPTYPPPPRLETHQHPPPMRVSTSQYDYQKSGAKTFTVEEVERSRMLRHTRFNYFDSTLKNERQRCAEALARYNNACMLRSGVTELEAQNMLMKVFDPSLDLTHHPVAPCKEKGVLGPGVKIEGPFKCTYGYNLRIMDNVFIGENTRIDDSARVDIGARTWIGPNVTILTTDVSKDMVDRKGTESTCYAAPVVIHPEVVIGSNAVIYPGVTLSRGSTVEPFALVRDSLGENQIQRAAVGPRATA